VDLFAAAQLARRLLYSRANWIGQQRAFDNNMGGGGGGGGGAT